MKQILKNIPVFIYLLLMVTLFVPQIASIPAYADPPTSTGGSSSCSERSFLGFVPWDCGTDLETIDSTDGLGDAIWTIVANIATDLTTAASYLVLGYTIYGGYLYIFANGEANKVLNGKRTLAQAFVGLAIVMSASVIMNTIRLALNFGNLEDCLKDDLSSACVTSPQDASAMVTNVIQWVIGIAGAVALIFVVIGAISYITSSGDAGKIAKARNVILYALIGLVIVAIAEIATAFVSSRISESLEATPGETSSRLVPTSIAQTNLIRKEPL